MHTSAATIEHRSKRPFQPSITSYFAHLDDDYDYDYGDDAAADADCRWALHPNPRPHTHHHHNHHHLRRDSLAPVVPGPVQADLLSVGMRVRKSVPEGYKTTTTTKMATLPSIQTTLAVPRPPTLAVKPPADPVPDDFVHQRELLPFCGLHKIGGYAEQPTTNIHLYAGLDATGARATNAFPLPAEAFKQPFSSSNGSTDSGYDSTSPYRPLNPSKRSWHDDDMAPLSTNTNFFFAIPVKGPTARVEEVPVSPLSESPPPAFGVMPATRLFAQPKSRRARQRAGEADEMMDVDGDYGDDAQLEGRVAAGSGSDFEEADFLGREVDMGGL